VLSGEATNTNFSLWVDPIGARTHMELNISTIITAMLFIPEE
jgi:hypothetical protein